MGLNKPKCLVEVGGKTLLAQHLERLAEIPNVWVVVGFQEELVIEQVRNLRRDAIIVRNPDFDRTNTLQSIHRVSRYLDRRFLAVDGDTFIENRSFERFLRAAAGQAGLIGVSRYTTSDGVRVLLDAGGEAVTAFTREPQHAYEWTGIAILRPDMVVDRPIYVYQALEPYLPLSAQELDAFDIDTASDLDMARRVHLNNWNLND
nr:NTP transferase domain-containing protein [Pseudomonas aeruginosa]